MTVSSVTQSPTDLSIERYPVRIGMSLEEYRFATMPMPAAALTTDALEELAHNRFATVPMTALAQTLPSRFALEEEWHAAFEEAISARAARVSQRLQRLASAELESSPPVTDPLPASPLSFWRRAGLFWRAHTRVILLSCLGLVLFLLGFDLMGLLLLVR